MEKDQLNPHFKVVLIGGSAGSLEVLMKILPKMTGIPNYALVIILHRKVSEDNLLEQLFSVKTSVPVKQVEDKTKLTPGFIYVAPSNYHLLFEKQGLLSLDISEKVNYSRPSIDVSFESAADAFGANVTGILLSGANADGTQGLIAIKEAGGTVVIQQPASAEMPYMPDHALANIAADYVLDPNQILEFLGGDAPNHRHD